jgi:hypothetical protein
MLLTAWMQHSELQKDREPLAEDLSSDGLKASLHQTFGDTQEVFDMNKLSFTAHSQPLEI